MTANHTPTDDRRREQATPGQRTGQQSLRQQSQQPPQQLLQGQPTTRAEQQGQPATQAAQQGQPTPQAAQQGQPAPQTQPAQQSQHAPQNQPAQQTQPAPQTQPAQQSQHAPQTQPAQQGQPAPQTQAMQQGQAPPQQQPTQQSQPPQQSHQQPPQATGHQQMLTAQPAQGPPGQQRRQSQSPGSQQPLLKPVRVSEIITEDVATAERDTPIRTVVAKMAEEDVGSIVVVEEGRPIGIITDRKVAIALEEMPDITERTADELLHGDVFTADPSMSVFDAVQVMSDEGIRRLPIVDDDGALRGIVTLDDTLVLLGGVVSDIADTVQSQSPRL